MDYYQIKEDQNTELKTAANHLPLSLFETYSSFANTSGGVIYLGIKEAEPKNIISGVSNPKELKKNFFDVIHNKNKVSAAIVDESAWEEIDVDGKTIVRITINEAPIVLKPVYLNGNEAFAYLRGHEGDYLASRFELRAMQLDAVPQKFDMRPNAAGYLFEDLSKDTLASYRALFNAKNPDNLLLKDSDKDFFFHIGALKRNDKGEIVPTNAAILLFGTYPMIKEEFPEYNLDYRRDTSGTSRWDDRFEASSLTWSGNAFDFFREVVARLKPLLPSPFHLNGVYDEGVEPLLECVREALINAIANCDYLLPGGIKVLFTGGMLTFVNAGRLRLPLSQVMQGGDSDPRNEGVMNLLHLVKLGDKAGEGIPNIFRRMRALKYPDPLLEQSGSPSKTTLTLLLMPTTLETNTDIEAGIIRTLSQLEEAGVTEIATRLSLSPATISIALSKMLEAGVVITNGKKTKGKKFRLKNKPAQ